jgi:hypothetical protein
VRVGSVKAWLGAAVLLHERFFHQNGVAAPELDVLRGSREDNVSERFNEPFSSLL